jgi:hypothetical protein
MSSSIQLWPSTLIFLRTYLPEEDYNQEKKYDINAHTEGIYNTPERGKTKSRRHTQEDKGEQIKTGSSFANSFYNCTTTANPGRGTTYNARQHKNIEFYIQRHENFKF